VSRRSRPSPNEGDLWLRNCAGLIAAYRVKIEARAKREERTRLHKLLQGAVAAIDPEAWPSISGQINAELTNCDCPVCVRAYLRTYKLTDRQKRMKADRQRERAAR
jgi:hypothetical protein